MRMEIDKDLGLVWLTFPRNMSILQKVKKIIKDYDYTTVDDEYNNTYFVELYLTDEARKKFKEG